MSSFDPIAIIGEGCVLPGALSPQALWRQVLAGNDVTSDASNTRWGIDTRRVLCEAGSDPSDKTWSLRGGFVTESLPAWHHDGLGLDPEQLGQASIGVQWSVYAATQAMAAAGYHPDNTPRGELGVILGNLSYASQPTNYLFAQHWLQQQACFAGLDSSQASILPFDRVPPHHRFAASAPAQWVARALTAGGPAFCLDAACASSLYAIKLACDYLQAGKAKMMLAGAVNQADTLYLNIGFTALKALSRGGRSRPFDQAADGLVPGEGAAMVLLKPLRDALRDGDAIRGIIRGIGLSNDGRHGGFLSPSSAGEVRALAAAYQKTDIQPGDVSYIECHATGTAAGDRVELASINRFFQQGSFPKIQDIPLASLKSNLGHLITTAGAAGLIRLLQAMEHRQLAPSVNVTQPLAEFADGPARLLTTAESWQSTTNPVAGINAFGFGGNNAHMIVQHQWHTKNWAAIPAASSAESEDPIVICGIALRTAQAADHHQLLRRWAGIDQAPAVAAKRLGSLSVNLEQLGFPPSDLEHTNAQQMLVMELIRELLGSAHPYQADTTAVYTGIGINMETSRYTMRTRLSDWLHNWQEAGLAMDDDWLQQAQTAVTPAINAAGVLGTMPNMPANRSNHQLNLLGPSFTLSAEELSGVVALDTACRALQQCDINLAVVAAVDMAAEPVHSAALASFGTQLTDNQTDGAVALLLQRKSDAQATGRTIYAELSSAATMGSEAEASAADAQAATLTQTDVAAAMGNVHAAAGLLSVAAGALLVHHGLSLLGGGRLQPTAASQARHVVVETAAMSVVPGTDRQAPSRHIHLTSSQLPAPLAAQQCLYLFVGSSRDELIASIKQLNYLTDFSDQPEKAHRLAVIAHSTNELQNKTAAALAQLGDNGTSLGGQAVNRMLPGIYLAENPFAADKRHNANPEVACVFTGAASAYPGMGRELCALFPDSLQRTLQKHPVLETCLSWLDSDRAEAESPIAVLQGCTLLSQVHADITQHILGIAPDAMLGISSGETNSLFAAGAWRDMQGLFADIDQSRMYSHWIAGEYRAAQVSWNDPSVSEWLMLRVIGPVDEIQSLLHSQTRVHVTMINAHNDCVVAGEQGLVETFLPQLKRIASAVVPMGHDIIAHSPALKAWQQAWHDIHHRATTAPDRLRFYANAYGDSYALDSESVADALTQQAVNTVDFRPVVEAAYRDGVRIFIEQGPRNACSEWISTQLGEREHLAVALDRAGGSAGAFYESVAQLWCAGVSLKPAALARLCAAPHKIRTESKPAMQRHYPAHPPAIVFPPLIETKAGQTNQPDTLMPRAPELHDLTTSAGVLRSHPAVADSPAKLATIERIVARAAQANYDLRGSAAATQPASPTLDTAAPATIAVLQKLHAEITQNHQRYLAFQQQATDILLRASGQANSPTTNRELKNVQLLTGISVIPGTPPGSGAATRQSPELLTPTRDTVLTMPGEAAPDRTATQREEFPGPKFDRQQLETLASGRISDLFGPLFVQQDNYPRQVRMPAPPLLLADRVLGIDATPGAMENRGSIWTETDVTAEDWFVHHGHMPAGLMIEAGQADLLLISWMGADFENKGERVYRLLGCELTYRDRLPAIGDTLRYDIHLDGYAKQGDVRLFFFHYNCEIAGNTHLEVRRGQAGFFTYEELANSAGVIWAAANEQPREDLAVAAGPCHTRNTHFSKTDIDAFAAGDLVGCFGDDFFKANCHQRTPTIVCGDKLMFDEVLVLDHQGGPWQRGYLKAELKVKPDHWFFEGHFKNDPCAPGTLMLEGGVQVLSFYLASMGFTLERDGWRFVPIKDESFNLICRSQLVPGGKKLEYEIFVHGVAASPRPQLRVDLLCTVDGRKAFLGQGVGIELVPGWPVESRLDYLPEPTAAGAALLAREGDFAFDAKSMVACAWGRPSEAFGPHYRQHDGPRRGPRLPGYPYHFISRVVSVEVAPRQMQAGATAVMAYDIPADAWYFSENSQATMPFPVLLEAALQPCGWLATYMGGGFAGREEVFFRNLDGSASQYRELSPADTTLITRVKNTRVSVMGGMTIVGFEVQTSSGEQLIYEMDTVFGFFPAESLAQQAGLPTTEAEQQAIAAPAERQLSLQHRPPRYFAGSLRLPGPMLTLLDSISGYWPKGGSHGKGRVRGHMQVDSNAWFFKSHFYGDPVQPGSLGLEMMLQCLQFYALEENLGNQLAHPRFVVPAEIEHSWSYRGQVLPHNKAVVCDLSITDIRIEPAAIVLTANASLWVDDQKIYKADNLSLIVKSETATDMLANRAADKVFDAELEPWINDHCPTYTVAALPFTSFVDLMVDTALARMPARKVVGLKQVRVNRWLSFTSPRQALRRWGVATTARQVDTRLATWNEITQRYQEVARGTVLVDEEYRLAPKAWSRLAESQARHAVYDTGELFHGPAFQALVERYTSAQGVSGIVDIARVQVPPLAIHPGFLDACLHVIPHGELHTWFPQLEAGMAAYPLLMESANFYGPTPQAGRFRVEARPLDIHPTLKLPRITLQIIDEREQLWADMILVEALLPKGPLGQVDDAERYRFFVEHDYVPSMGLSSPTLGDTQHSATLDMDTVQQSNWLPGTLEMLYDCDYDRDQAEQLTQAILVKELLAEQWRQHPRYTCLRPQPCASLTDNRFWAFNSRQLTQIASVTVSHNHPSYRATTPFPVADTGGWLYVRDFWREQLGYREGLIEDFFLALLSKFTGQVKTLCAQSAGLTVNDAPTPRGVLYVANHQTGVESVLFAILMSALRRQPVFALAKKEHAHSWIGKMLEALFAGDTHNPELLELMDREDPQAVLQTMSTAMNKLAEGSHSMLVHIAGTRATEAREPQTVLSGSLIDAAIANNIDIVPVRFHGGLPLEPVRERLEFPTGYGVQHWTLGPAIGPGSLRKLNNKARKETVLNGLNRLDDLLRQEAPNGEDTRFSQQVARLRKSHDCTETQAVLRCCLAQSPFALSTLGKRLMSLATVKQAAISDIAQDDHAYLLRVLKMTLGGPFVP